MSDSEVVTIRKKPIEVHAVRWNTANFEEVYVFTGGNVRESGWGLIEVYDHLHNSWIKVKPMDYVIRGLRNEYYPHDGDLIWDAYDKVE